MTAAPKRIYIHSCYPDGAHAVDREGVRMTAADHDQCPWCKGWGHDGMDCPYVKGARAVEAS